MIKWMQDLNKATLGITTQIHMHYNSYTHHLLDIINLMSIFLIADGKWFGETYSLLFTFMSRHFTASIWCLQAKSNLELFYSVRIYFHIKFSIAFTYFLIFLKENIFHNQFPNRWLLWTRWVGKIWYFGIILECR